MTNPKVYYDAGIHEIWIAGRSRGHSIDRFVLYHSTANGTTAQTNPESERAADSIVYIATNDFPSITGGEVPYYKDTGNNALAINAANTSYRDKWARAELIFDGSAGTYDVTLTSLKELDGECSYRLLINGTQIGEVQNDETTADYQEQNHVFRNVNIPAGATIAVESITDSNGKVPEGDAYAWARGRWRQIELTPNTTGTGLSVDAGADQTLYFPPVSATLTGSASDDGSVVSTVWLQVSGPNAATLAGTNTLTLTASNLIEGEYVFRLTATDNEAHSLSDTVTVTIENEPPIIPATVLWAEDFEGAALGASATNNSTLSGTTVQCANNLGIEVVAAPAGFTTASGQAALISSGPNAYAALRTITTVDLSAYYFRAGDNYSLAFDLYLPATVAAPVAGVNFRWKDAANTGNGPTETSEEQSAAGVYRVEYTGTFPVDTGSGDFFPTEVRPFIWFDQDGAALSEFAYIDNLEFKIWAPNYAPEFDEDPVDGGTVAEGQSYSGNLASFASDPNGDSLTFAKTGGPAWLTVAAGGAMSGIPGAADRGTNTFTVSVQDTEGASASATLTIFVDEPPPRLPLTVLWEEDFNEIAVGTASGNNQTLAGTDVQTANMLSGEVVAAPAGFTNASGNVFMISTGSNSYSAIRTPSEIDLSGYPIQEGDTFKLSFDLYIPATLPYAVGGVNYRWKDAVNTGNGPTDSTYETLAAGVHHIEYIGTFPVDAGAGDFIPANVRPFIWFDQNGAAADDYVYFDNLHFEIMGAVEAVGFSKFEEDYGLLLGKTGDDDGDGIANLIEYAIGGDPTNSAVTGYMPNLEIRPDGNAYFSMAEMVDRSNRGIRYEVQACTNLVEGGWFTLFENAQFTNSIDGTVEFEEVQHRFWAGSGSPDAKYVRLIIAEE